MQVVCGECSTRFALPDEKVRGRQVRIVCGRCGASIEVSASSEPAATERAPRNRLDTIPTTPEELARLMRLGTRDSHSDTQPNPISAALLGTARSVPQSHQEEPVEPEASPAFSPSRAPPAEARPDRPIPASPHLVLAESEDRPSLPRVSRKGWWLGLLALMACILAASMAARVISLGDVLGFVKGMSHRFMRSH